MDAGIVSKLIDELDNLKELVLHQRLLKKDYKKEHGRALLRMASLKPTGPINLNFKFDRYVRCLLDPVVDEEDSNSSYRSWPPSKDTDSPFSSRRSDESDQSYYSTTDYDPYESNDGMDSYSE